MTNNNCVYFHINETTNEIFYVGMGQRRRPYARNRSQHWHRIVAKYGYRIQIVKDNLTWEQAELIETFWIKTLGRLDKKEGLLINKTDGGGGAEGFKHTEETKKKISEAGKGRIFTEEVRKKIADSNRGKHIVSDEIRQKISIGNKGKIVSEESRLKMSISLTGHETSIETKQKISAANTGKKRTPEMKLRMSIAAKNRKKKIE